LDVFLAPYAGSHGMPVRVWGVDAGPAQARLTMENELFGGPPRLVLVGAGEDGLSIVRQTHEGLEDLDGVRVPWDAVTRVDRDPHLVRDVLRIEVAGHEPLSIAVSNHVLLPTNRTAAKALCDLARHPKAPSHADHERQGHHPLGLEANPA
jgi:hypothetical protein